MTSTRPSDQALAVPVEPVSRLDPAGFDPSREDLRGLSKPQKRVLLGTVSVPPNATRGYRVTGAQWPPVLKLRHLGLLFVDDFSGHFCRDTMWLRPTDKGLAWARAIATEAGTAETGTGSVHEGAGLQGIAQAQSHNQSASEPNRDEGDGR